MGEGACFLRGSGLPSIADSPLRVVFVGGENLESPPHQWMKLVPDLLTTYIPMNIS